MRLSLSFQARQSGFPFSGSINWLALGAVSNHVALRMNHRHFTRLAGLPVVHG